MHIQITDFGSALIIENEKVEANKSCALPNSSSADTSNQDGQVKRKNSFVGTAHYVSPEMLTNKESTASSDLWALGCIVYQMTSGLPPFRAANEYLIFQKIINLNYEFPDGFNEKAKNLVESFLQIDPTKRLGATDHLDQGGYVSIRNHEFLLPLKEKFSNLHNETPPKLLPYLPGTSENEEIRSDYNVEPGLAERQLQRLLGLALCDDKQSETQKIKKGILDISTTEIKERLEKQRLQNIFHRFVENNLILKQGFVDKRKGLFARRRMLLLTTGPHLYYVDASNMVLKGQIPWSKDLKPEAKTFKTFFVHTVSILYFIFYIGLKIIINCDIFYELAKSNIFFARSRRKCPRMVQNNR